jgi:hypothetical protein
MDYYNYGNDIINGTVPAGMTVLVQADSVNSGNGGATLESLGSPNNCVNNGTIRLTSTYGSANADTLSLYSTFTNQGLLSIDPDPVAGVTNQRIITGTLVNTGIIAVNTSAQFGYPNGTAGSVTNAGAFNVASGAIVYATTFNQTGGTLSVSTGASFNVASFTLQGGQVNVNGQLSIGTLNYGSGTLSTTAPLTPATVNFLNSNPVSLSLTLDSPTSTVGGTAVPAGVTLTVQPTPTTTAINLYLPTINNGTLNLTSAAGGSNQISIEPSLVYTLTNNGLISVSSDPSFAGTANNSRGLTGQIINQGAVNIASGAIFSVGTFNQVGGTLTVNGTLSGTSANNTTFYLNGGTLAGTGTINYPSVSIAPGNSASISGITLLLDTHAAGLLSNQLTGDIPTGLTVLDEADAANLGAGNSTLKPGTNETSSVNNGTLRLTSTYGRNNSVSLTATSLTNQGLITIDPDPASGVTNTRTLSGTFINAAAGEIDFNTYATTGSGGATIINYGTINASVIGGAPGTLFNQAGGSLNLQGVFGSGQLVLAGGTVTGPGAMATSNLSIGTAFSGGGTVELYTANQSATLNGPSGWNLPAGTTVDFYQPLSFPFSITGATNNPLTNNGTIRLSSATGTTNSVSLNLNGTLTNNGLFSVDPDVSASASQTARVISGTIMNNAPGTLAFNTTTNANNPFSGPIVINNGTCTIAGGATANFNAFNQAGGTLIVNGSLVCETFNYSGGTVTGSARIDPSLLVISSSVSAGSIFTNAFESPTSGTVPAGVNLVFTPGGPTYYGGAFNTFTTLTNNGRIDLSGNGSTAAIQVPITTLTNAGVLAIDANSVGGSTLYNTITNTVTGSIEVDGTAILTGVTSNSGTVMVARGATASNGLAFLQQSGTLDIEGTFTTDDFTFNGGSIYGAGTMVLNPSLFTVGPGDHDIPVSVVANQALLTINGNLSLDGSFSINPGQTVSKAGAGALTILGPQSHSSGAVLNVSAGTVVFATDPGANLSVLAGNGTVHISAANSGAVADRNLGNLNLSAGGLVVVDPPMSSTQRMVLALNSLHFAGSLGNWQGQVDLTANDLIIHNGNVADLNDQISSGYSGGSMTGNGILSSTAAADTTHLTTLGMLPNNDGTGTAIYSTFDGQPAVATDMLIKYTYYGDANLDGKVDGSDYSRIDNGSLMGLTGWSNGDFNYDGVIDGSDYTLIDNAYNTQGAQLSAQVAAATALIAEGSAASAVPEPAAACLLICSSIGLLGRRRISRLHSMQRSINSKKPAASQEMQTHSFSI